MQVWKYVLNLSGKLEFQAGAEILSAGVQNDAICLWAKVDPDANKEILKYRVYGTGHNIPNHLELKFIGTVMMDNLVFHVFEEI